MALTTLIETSALEELIRSQDVVIADCRFALDDVSWGEREYQKLHVPGAVFVDLDRHLAGEKTGRNGRHPLPHPDTLAVTFGSLGIGDGVQVVAYDQDSGVYASRLWWMLRWLGHDAVAVLSGGFAKWTREGRATASGKETRQPRTFRAVVRPGMSVDLAAVAALAGRVPRRLLDARAPERFRGDVETIDKVGGHIPGARTHPFKTNLSADDTFKSREELRRQFEQSLGGTPASEMVCYCGSGVTACHNLLALEHAGLVGAKLYAGSWSEWSADPERPIEKGNEGMGNRESGPVRDRVDFDA